MSVIPNYYKNRVCLNVLAHSVENAKACYEAAEGHVVLGVLSKNYASDEAAIEDMKRYQDATNNALSVGLGAGDPNQSQMVSRLSGFYNHNMSIKYLLAWDFSCFIGPK